MAYTRNPTWQDSPSVATPITAASLNALEAGLVNAAGVADSSITALAGKEPAISRTGATTGQVATLQAGGTLAFATPAAGGGTVAAATTTTQGIVQLAGDLAGTAAAPTVPALATQAAAIAAKAPLLIPTVVKTTAYTAVSGDLVRADATTASFAVTLPAAVVGSTLAVKKVDTSVNTITITPAGTDTIDGLTTAVLRLPNATQRLIAVVGGWVVADGFNALSALDARYDAAGAAATREPAISRTGATTGQVPVLQAGGGLAFATPAAGGGGPRLGVTLPSASNAWRLAYQQTGNRSTNVAFALNTIYFTPFLCFGDVVKTIGYEINTAGGAGALVRLGLYSPDVTTGLPGALLVDAGQGGGTGLGVQGVAIANTTMPTGIVWAALVNQGGTAAGLDGTSNFYVTYGSSGLYFFPSLGVQLSTTAATYSAGLPATLAANSFAYAMNQPSPGMGLAIA